MTTVSTIDRALADLGAVRERTLALVAGLDDPLLERVVDPILSPLVWDLAHIAAFEDLWLAGRLGGLPPLRPELMALYDALLTPRAVRGERPLLDAAESRAYMAAVRERVAALLAERGPGDGLLVELVIRHELQHTETMRQTLALTGRLPAGEPRLDPAAGGEPGDAVAIPGGEVSIGAGPEGFAYDNERPRHRRVLAPFRIDRRPVSNAAWRRVTGERRDGAPGAAVCHVSWHEADAFARRLGARLPTEFEWEHAATLGLLDGVGQVWEWTATRFAGYPGFRPDPYPEYSQVFFGDRYRVLRGRSWATDRRVGTLTFRNWDLPQRRNIFAGLRLAWEAA